MLPASLALIYTISGVSTAYIQNLMQLSPRLRDNYRPTPRNQLSPNLGTISLISSQSDGRRYIRVTMGHHKLLIDKCSNNRDKALFYVNLSLKNGWSRAVLLNVLDTNLYERSGKLSSIMSYSHSPYLWLSVAAETGILWRNCGWNVRLGLSRILRDWCFMTHTH